MDPFLEPQVLARLERLVALARRTPPRSRRQQRQRGAGIEIGERRDYAPGDDVRLIDWPAYARLERLLVKVAEELPQPRLDLVLDASGSMGCGDPPPRLRAGLSAAALAAVALARGARVTVWGAGPGLPRCRLGRAGELLRLLRTLAELPPAGPGCLEAAAGQALAADRLRGGAVVVSDGLDGADVVAAARRLVRGGREVLVVQVLPEQELSAQASAAAAEQGEVELVDAETGATLRAPYAELWLDKASAARQARRQALERGLSEAGIPFTVSLPAVAFEAPALETLRP